MNLDLVRVYPALRSVTIWHGRIFPFFTSLLPASHILSSVKGRFTASGRLLACYWQAFSNAQHQVEEQALPHGPASL